jgi:eukaryotic-like serine/threonine-protein kinase
MAVTVLADRYELEELVGRGGMSSVYRARDRSLGRLVAIKLLHEQYLSDSEQVERFRREARAVATLAHPNVAVVIDRGEEDGRPYIVFEYVEGGNLKALIEREAPLPLEKVLQLGIQIARGLEHAHRSGLIHRDVKPHNVLLDAGGQVKLIDFGIARSSTEVRPGLTLTGTVLGSSDYIAPEQAQGRTVEDRTDVYSLAIVLYELLTGKLPFPGGNFVAVAMRHINEEPPPVADHRKDVPARLTALMQQSLLKDPEQRPTMSEVVRELEQTLLELPGDADTVLNVPAVRVRSKAPSAFFSWRLRSPLAAVLAAVLVAAAVGVYLIAFGTGGGSTPAGVVTAIHLRATTAFDPYGTNGEHNAQAPLATDNNAETFWETENYHDAPSLDKPGVGLVLDAGRPVSLHHITVTTSTPGFVAEIKAGSAADSFPDTVSGKQTTTTRTRFDVSGNAHRYYLLWIVELGPGFHTARISQVTGS